MNTYIHLSFNILCSRELLKKNQNETLTFNLSFSSCLLANISICKTTQNSNEFLVAVYNPLSWTVNHLIRLPVANASYTIEGPDGKEEYDILSTIPYFQTDISNQTSETEIVFTARNLPPMGVKLYHVSKTDDDKNTKTYADEDKFYYGDEVTPSL